MASESPARTRTTFSLTVPVGREGVHGEPRADRPLGRLNAVEPQKDVARLAVFDHRGDLDLLDQALPVGLERRKPEDQVVGVAVGRAVTQCESSGSSAASALMRSSLSMFWGSSRMRMGRAAWMKCTGVSPCRRSVLWWITFEALLKASIVMTMISMPSLMANWRT